MKLRNWLIDRKPTEEAIKHVMKVSEKKQRTTAPVHKRMSLWPFLALDISISTCLSSVVSILAIKLHLVRYIDIYMNTK